MSNWLQLKAVVDQTQAEILEDGMLAAGASAVTMMDAEDQAILEPEIGTTPLWKKTTVIGLFEAETDIEWAQQVAAEIYFNQTQQDCTLQAEVLENEDWTRKWIENFKPIKFGRRLWVCPSWCEPPESDAINLNLDPGLAFGTGTHPTTALCLEWLDSIDLRGKTVLDYGCGSGILGIAACLLGAEKVYAVDNDPQALIATQENAQRNQLNSNKVQTFLPDDFQQTDSDILVANILAAPLMSLRDTMLSSIKQNAQIALSGILIHQAQDILAHYGEKVASLEQASQGDWVRISSSVKKI